MQGIDVRLGKLDLSEQEMIERLEKARNECPFGTDRVLVHIATSERVVGQPPISVLKTSAPYPTFLDAYLIHRHEVPREAERHRTILLFVGDATGTVYAVGKFCKETGKLKLSRLPS